MNPLTYSFCYTLPRYIDPKWYFFNRNYYSPITPQTPTKEEQTQSFLIKSDSSTIQSEVNEENKRKLKSMLDNYAHEFRHKKSKRTEINVIILNDAIKQINEIPSSTLSSITSHKFYNTIRDLIRDLLFDWQSTFKLNQDDTVLLRNCVFFLNRLVHAVQDVTVLTSLLLDPSLINTISNGMTDINQLLINDQEKHNFKQLIRLVQTFSTYYQQLPLEFKNNNKFNQLFDGIMNCLISSNYDKIFRKLKVDTKSMTIEEKFFLIQCPSFLISHQNSQSNKIKEQILETMIPRYASILNKHIKSITEWNSPMIRSVHHLLLTVIHAKGYYTPYANGQPLQWLIDHIICIISESTIIKKIDENCITSETILIDSAVKTLVEFVHEPDLLCYIKQLKIIPIFLSLLSLPYESIVYHVYILLSYTMSEDDIKSSEKESGRLLSDILDSLRKKINLLTEKSQNEEYVKHDIALLLEAVQGFVQHDQIKSEIINQNALLLLTNSCQYLGGNSKRFLLESLGSISFDKEAAQLLRENTEFINSVEDIQNTTDEGMQKAAENIIWNVIKEPEYREKVVERETETANVKFKDKKKEITIKHEFQYDFMISYCHADKELVCKIQEFLVEQGFKVWFDRDNMYGPAMQSMATAVENSEFVIMCMSDSYKRSVYCQAEAEYAFRCNRHLLPIIVRQGYRPDGWLGLLLGSRIYINFARFEFKKACQLLLNEVTLQRQNQQLHIDGINQHQSYFDIEPITPNAIQSKQQTFLSNQDINRDTTNANYHSISVNNWTQKDVVDFLFDTNLRLMIPLCESMTGYGLIKLFRICQEKPNEFYNQLNDELRSRFHDLKLPLAIFTQFLGEMDRLINSLTSPKQKFEHDQIKPTPVLSSRPSPPPPPPILVRNFLVGPNPPSLLPLPRRLSVPITLLSSPHQAVSSTFTRTQTSHNVHFIDQTSNRSNSLPGQIGCYESTLNFLNETASQPQPMNTGPYRRASYAYGTHVKQTFFKK